MIEENTHNVNIDKILKENFKGYQVSNDPYEKVAVYSRGGIIGIISYSIIYERAEINYIIVTDPNRHNGIGSNLLEFALADIVKHNCQVISLEVEEGNLPAINLYLKYGFIKKALRENYYKNKNAILMVKELRWKYGNIYFSNWIKLWWN